MEKWKEFYVQAKQDLKSSKELREAEYFGNSAYFLQQSVEKYVKAIIYRYCLLYIESKDLGHYPFIQILEETKNLLKNPAREVEACCVLDTVNEILYKTKTVLDYENGKKPPKKLVAIWKKSLDISMTDNNELAILTDLNDFKPKFEKVINNYKGLLDKKWSDIPEEHKKQYQPMFDSIDKCIQLQKNNRFKLDDKYGDETIRLLFEVFKLFEIFKIRFRLGENIYEIFLQLIWFFLILALSDIMIKTYPHESIGRYPIEIGDESSRWLYQKQSQNLTKLSNEVETICKKLDNAIG